MYSTHSRCRGWSSFAVLLLCPAAALAQEAGQNAIQLEEITVTSTRVEESAQKIPAAVSVVGQDEVQLGRQQIGLDESLAEVPGLFLQNRYNFAQDLRISIRGFGARANFGIRGVKIIVDGIPLTLPDGQGGIDSIDLGSIEQIEVIRGPASSLYGNASGGVISITTEEGPPTPFVEPRLSFGEYGFYKHQLKTGGDTGRLNYLVNVSDFELDGYRDYSHAESTQFNSKFTYDIDPSSELQATLNVVDTPFVEDPGALTRAQVEQDREQAASGNLLFDAGEELEQQRLGLVYRKDFGERHELQLRNYYVWRDFMNKLPFVDGGSVEIDRFFYGGGAAYTYTGDVFDHRNRLIVGLDVDRQDDDRKRFDNNMGEIGALVFDQRELVTSTGVFVQNEFNILENLELTLGARYDEVEFEVEDDFLADGDDSGSRTLEETSPMVGLLYSPLPEINLYGNISTAFETPTTTEFANPSGAGGFNPNIEPQLATNYEIGVKGTIARRHSYELALFTIEVEDELIPFEIAGMPGRDFFVNAGESEREGLELTYSGEPIDGLTLTFSYTYSDFTFDRFRQGGDVFDGNDIPGIPEHQLYGEIGYFAVSGFYGVMDVLYVDEFFADNANTVESDDYTVSSLRGGYSGFFENWEYAVFAGINNLFDEEYNSNVRINAFGGRFFEPAPERNLYGGVSARYNF